MDDTTVGKGVEPLIDHKRIRSESNWNVRYSIDGDESYLTIPDSTEQEKVKNDKKL